MKENEKSASKGSVKSLDLGRERTEPFDFLPRIDTHSHYLPDFYREALVANGHGRPDGMPAVPQWSEESHLELMDNINVKTSILSISSPGIDLKASDNGAAIELARKCNAYAASLKRKHAEKNRFGFFAITPLPNVDAAITEMNKALNDGADGVGLETNYSGIYLGDPRLDKFMAELDRRRVTVFVHPTSSTFCPHTQNTTTTTPEPQIHNPLSHLVPSPVLEFFFETARTMTSLILSGTLTKYKNITWIFAHMGGAFPPLLSRVTGFATYVPNDNVTVVNEDDLVKILNERVYFDLAGWAFPKQWKGLIEGAGVGYDRLLYGTDFPFTNANAVANFAEFNDCFVMEDESWSEERVKLAWYENARKLFKLP